MVKNSESFEENINVSFETKSKMRTNSLSFKYIDPHFNVRNLEEVFRDGERIEHRKKIVGCFLYKGVNTFFYSKSNMGKSLLGFNMGFCAATGQSMFNNSALMNECLPMRVLVIDVELDERDLLDRHMIVKEHLPDEYLENFIFIHEELQDIPLFGIELLKKIEIIAMNSGAELIIIDNLTKLISDQIDPKLTAEVIATLQRIRKKTGASFLVIGHTSKSDKRLAIKNDSYFGSAFIENFFFEIFYLDETIDGRYFLRQTKTKREEKYEDIVPVFLRGKHPILGVGFTFEDFFNYTDIKKPDFLNTQTKRNLPISDFAKEIKLLIDNGVKQARIAQIFNVSRSAISKEINRE